MVRSPLRDPTTGSPRRSSGSPRCPDVLHQYAPASPSGLRSRLAAVSDGQRNTPPDVGTHLFVCQHGLWGSTDDVAFLEAYLRHNGWQTLNARCNSARLTYDGIDCCGDRLADEVWECVRRMDADRHAAPVTHVSFAGYSLGGLIVRYALGKLLAKGFFSHVKPVK